MPDRMISAETFSPFAPSTSEPDLSHITSEADIEASLRGDQEPEPPGAAICAFGTGRFEVSQDGVEFISGEGAAKRICDELRIEAKTRDAQSGNWGRLLRWRDSDGKTHTWSMPMAQLQGDPTEVARELAAGGLSIVPGQQRRLCEYLQVWNTDERMRCVDQLGWHGTAYCTPDETIGGSQSERITFQSTSSIAGAHAKRGSVEAWRNNVAALAAGNSRLLFAISCAFAGPLLDVASVESGGFHFTGASSSGKTTALRVGASVWGHPEKYVRQWRATANGLEGLAAVHNDGLLILDELSQCDPKQAGEAAYMLANGKGKARASRSGSAREAAAWRILFLSSGEVPLSALMEGIGKKANAGQELRLANVPADAGAGLGIFEALRGHTAPAFANTLSAACNSFHGSVGTAYLQRLVAADRQGLAGVIRDGLAEFAIEVVPPGASGQVERVARRFGLIAAAGELAARFGLTGWSEGEASTGIRQCFESWMENFGVGSHEEKAVCEMVRLYLVRHGSSRFQSVDANATSVLNRAGFWRDGANGQREYLVPTSTFKAEVVPGCDVKRAVQIIKQAGLLIPGSDKNSISVRLPEMGQQRVYCLTIKEEVGTCV